MPSGPRSVPWFSFLLFCSLCVSASQAKATLFAGISGTVHDPQHRPVPDAGIQLQATYSSAVLHTQTDREGRFTLTSIPFGDYKLTVDHSGFAPVVQFLTLLSGTSSVLHVTLPLAGKAETVTVTADSNDARSGSVTPTTLLDQHTLEQTPNAARTNSLAMITDYVPGAYVTHDMLHIRGGHQVSWLLDGVQIPNTNISSNLGAQIDPRDIAYLQIDRGSYDAELGNRTYGVFDVNPKSGFERDRQGELLLTVGSALQTDDQISFGDHSPRSAYYLSLNGNRSDYGLAPPIEKAVHNAENGYGGFGSFQFNKDAHNQLRLLAQLRSDNFQIPYDPDPGDYENQLFNSSGLRDTQRESDGILAFTWSHGFKQSAVVTVSPFYHANSAQYEPGPADLPAATTSYRDSRYAGVQASLSGDLPHNHLEAGLYSWGQHDRDLLAVSFNDGSDVAVRETDSAAGGLVEEYISDTYRPTSRLTFTAGVRQSIFTGVGQSQTAASPRVGAALQIPRLNWVFRAFYGKFYQPPPLLTVGEPLLQLAQSNDTSFAPLHGERDEEHQFGVWIPYRGWVLDADTFGTKASDYLDHANIGESSIYLPVTIAHVRVQAWEATLRSPKFWHVGELHLAYSNQIAKQSGALTGGLVCYPTNSPECDAGPGYTPLDHDQRNTLNVGGIVTLPLGLQASTNVYYGSGFLNGYPGPPSPYPGAYLAQHTTFDLRLSRDFGENLTLAVSSTNVANRRVLLDNSLTFGGFHQNDPRQIYGELRYRFRY